MIPMRADRIREALRRGAETRNKTTGSRTRRRGASRSNRAGKSRAAAAPGTAPADCRGRRRPRSDRAPALHRADHGDDDDTDRQCKQSALFAGDGKTESQPCESRPEIRPPFPKAGDERCDRQQAERERGNISIAIPDCTNTIWLRKGSTQMRPHAGPCAANRARPHRYIATIRAIRTARSDSASPAAHLRTPESISPSTLSPAADASGRAAGSA